MFTASIISERLSIVFDESEISCFSLSRYNRMWGNEPAREKFAKHEKNLLMFLRGKN